MALAVTGSRSHSEKNYYWKIVPMGGTFSELFLTHSFLAPIRPTVPYNCCVYHTIIHHLSVCLSVLPSFLLSPNYHPKFDFQENRSHDSVQTRPLCLPETSEVQYPLSLYECIQLLQLNDFWVVLVSPLIIGYSPTAADGSALCCIIGGSHGRS